MAAIPKPPGMAPVSISATFTSFLAIPPCSMRLPTSMKKGIAIREKESILVTVDWASIWIMFPPPFTREKVAIQLSPRLTAMGTVQIRHKNRTPNIVPIMTAPPSCYLLFRSAPCSASG